MFNERRASARGRETLAGVVRSGGGQGVSECVVRNRSATGAKLSVGKAGSLPQRFQLKIGSDGWREVTVRWRRGNDVGVSFDR